MGKTIKVRRLFCQYHNESFDQKSHGAWYDHCLFYLLLGKTPVSNYKFLTFIRNASSIEFRSHFCNLNKQKTPFFKLGHFSMGPWTWILPEIHTIWCFIAGFKYNFSASNSWLYSAKILSYCRRNETASKTTMSTSQIEM